MPLNVHRAHHSLDGAWDQRPRPPAPTTLGTRGILASPFAHMGLLNNGFAQATREVLTQLPHGLGHLGSARFGIGQLLLQPIEPLVKASVECVAQPLPLGACAHLG